MLITVQKYTKLQYTHCNFRYFYVGIDIYSINIY